MSFENDRARRFDTIMDLLKRNRDGLLPQVLYREVYAEITRTRLMSYLKEMEWCGIVVILKDGRVRLK